MKSSDYQFFPVNFKQELDTGLVCITAEQIQGSASARSIEQAKEAAKTFIFDHVLRNFKEGVVTAVPPKAKDGDVIIDLGFDGSLKIMLRNLMLEKNCRPHRLANLLNISKQNLNGMLDFNKKTKVDTLARAFEVLGKPLQISC